MIRLLKNKEVMLTVLYELGFAALACAVVFIITESITAVYAAAGASAVIICVSFISTLQRYRKIASFASDVDRVLHGDDTISFSNYSEGELAVLQSEIHKMTVRLREQQQNLMQDKVFLADSIADISHQIRTPLTSINLMLELLYSAKTDEARRSELIMELKVMLSRIDWLITALLKISKLDAGTVQLKKETVTLKELAQAACAPLLVPLELRDITLEINAEGNFTGDVAWTCEALGNILKNCMEHTPAGGSIEVNCHENALYTQIEIRDSGKGIAKEDMPHIFERFYKGKDSDKNSFGIGLALSRMIISSQNGTVKAENAKPAGALFTVRFYKSTV